VKSSRLGKVLAILCGCLVLLAIAGGLFWYGVGIGWWGPHSGPGEISGKTIPSEIVSTRAAQAAQATQAIGAEDTKQILFGDWHVHTTISSDAYRSSLPQAYGEGAHPPADACDFARFCSGIDFWALTDHAEHMTSRDWQESVQSVRQCNAVTDPANPDVVAFIGWEWTQQGMDPKDHYGHKNVILRGLDDDEITARPIAPGGLASDISLFFPPPSVLRQNYLKWDFDPEYLRYSRYSAERRAIENCAEAVNSRDLPKDCRELADTPKDLFRKLNEWGVDSIVVPHGTTWGLYTAPGNDWRKQLTPDMQDPNRQWLVEIFSGHGNSEYYRSWRNIVYAPDGSASCPAPTEDFVPGCWRAGEIIAERCAAAGFDSAECEKRAAEARQNYVDVGSIGGHLTVPGASAADWQDSSQCRDCFMPTFSMRPLGSVQYMMAIRNFEGEGEPLRFDFGFIGSSDNHKARGGTGYKAYERTKNTEAGGGIARATLPSTGAPVAQSRKIKFGDPGLPIYSFVESERYNSYLSTGGLMAVHSTGRDRNSIWEAVKRKEAYATSGPRILLWFDLLNAPQGKKPMGSHIAMIGVPEFQVKAVGAQKQLPGCPDYSINSLSKERLRRLCLDECYNPSDERMLITRIEVVRIRPQISADESIDGLIEDPWKTLECPPDQNGCTVTFDDPDFASAGRDAVYYVRAIQEPSEEINGVGPLCHKRGEDGRCEDIEMCGTNKGAQDDCLSPVEERAWSSPILVDKAQ
jgi:hypothetical protein